jgi:aspartate carbamoyltransferase catalytic subunit
MALDALLKRCRAWKHKHLLGTRQLSRDDVFLVLDLAEELSRLKDEPPLKGLRLFNFFVEPSTRTKTSFALAARRLGAEVVDFSPSGSSLTKGESLKDTARTIESMGVAFTAIRHGASGAPEFLSRLVESSVINAGDGTNEHPTQALLDLLTMRQKAGRITGLRVALVGDIAHSRVARSNVWVLRKLGNEVTLVGPPTLVPKHFDVPVTHDFDRALRENDVVMMLRLQLERQAAGLFPSTSEYVRFFGLSRERLATLANGTIIMHPGPMNRGIEISAEAADSDRSVILNQVANGVWVRAAVLLLLSQVDA